MASVNSPLASSSLHAGTATVGMTKMLPSTVAGGVLVSSKFWFPVIVIALLLGGWSLLREGIPAAELPGRRWWGRADARVPVVSFDERMLRVFLRRPAGSANRKATLRRTRRRISKFPGSPVQLARGPILGVARAPAGV